jgi:CheY-like chemotaxis protein
MKQILLIEPNRILAMQYKSALENSSHSFVVTRAATAQDAIKSLDTQQEWYAIVLELQLAHHNGLEFLYELRSYPEWASIPVIVLSNISRAFFEKSKTFRFLGVAAFLQKSNLRLAALPDSIERFVSEATTKAPA